MILIYFCIGSEQVCCRCNDLLPDTAETEIFIRTFDHFFDSLNICSASEWTQKKKPDLKPYTSSDDERLKVTCARVCVFVHVYACMCANCDGVHNKC